MQQLVDTYGLWACYAGWAAWHRNSAWHPHGWKNSKYDVHVMEAMDENRTAGLVRAIITRSRSRQP